MSCKWCFHTNHRTWGSLAPTLNSRVTTPRSYTQTRSLSLSRAGSPEENAPGGGSATGVSTGSKADFPEGAYVTRHWSTRRVPAITTGRISRTVFSGWASGRGGISRTWALGTGVFRFFLVFLFNFSVLKKVPWSDVTGCDAVPAAGEVSTNMSQHIA